MVAVYLSSKHSANTSTYDCDANIISNSQTDNCNPNNGTVIDAIELEPNRVAISFAGKI